MKIIDRLEPVPRGIYSGALGYLDVRGGLDLCVVIRTLLVREGTAFGHSGGGIVADSEPGPEFRESLDKARPLLEIFDRGVVRETEPRQLRLGNGFRRPVRRRSKLPRR
jgi:anthranilate/para-aminobenzoate synthase component I